MLASGGSLIEISREDNSDPTMLNQFVYGTMRSALIYQRGGFALHSACLVPPGECFAVAIGGPSGAGKSTLATELVRRGWSLMGDDLTAVYQQPEGVMAWPSRDGIKLWRDACDRFEMNVCELQPLPGVRDKYTVPVETRQQAERLKVIYLLDRMQPEDVVEEKILEITGAERLAALMENSYRPHYLHALGCMQSHLEVTCAISQQVQLGRLRHSGTASACADFVEKSIQSTRSIIN
jgi:hypothetical protein